MRLIALGLAIDKLIEILLLYGIMMKNSYLLSNLVVCVIALSLLGCGGGSGGENAQTGSGVKWLVLCVVLLELSYIGLSPDLRASWLTR